MSLPRRRVSEQTGPLFGCLSVVVVSGALIFLISRCSDDLRSKYAGVALQVKTFGTIRSEGAASAQGASVAEGGQERDVQPDGRDAAGMGGHDPTQYNITQADGRCPQILVADERRLIQRTLGTGPQAFCQARRSTRIRFAYRARHRAYVRLSPREVRLGQLEIWMDSERVAPVLPTEFAGTSRQRIELPVDRLRPDADNVFELRQVEPGGWLVDRIDVEQFSRDEADPDKARAAWERSVALDRAREAKSRNLYDAWIEARRARGWLEGATPEPPLMRVVSALEADLETRLDAACDEQMREARRLMRRDDAAAAEQIFRSMLDAFPGDDHPCRAQAADALIRLGLQIR